MTTEIDNGGSRNAWRFVLWGGAAALLSLPAIAMALGADGVYWTPSDFVAMAVVLSGVCAIVEAGMALSRNLAYRFGFATAALAVFLTVWVNLAVGMIGDLVNPANLVFVGVLAIAAGGAVAGGFRAPAMAKAMLATAIAQLLAAGFALVVGTPLEAFLISLFAAPWLLAAGLFRLAAKDGEVPAR